MRHFPNQTRRAARLIAILVLAGCKPTSSEQAVRFIKRPYLQNPGQNEITIRWTTTLPTKCTVRYGVGEPISAILEVEPFDWAEAAPHREVREHLYRARLSGLRGSTCYRYEVTCDGTTIGGTFHTARSTAEAFTFVAYGDSRTQANVHSAVASCFRQHRPRFIIHVGDMVNSGSYSEWQGQFFDPLGEILPDVPLWPARGNHEGDAVAFAQLFELPRNVTYYSFDYGNAHFVCLDSTQARNAQMLAWCERDLAASRATWKFVFFHHPAYDAGHYDSRWGRDDFLPIFRRHGVDFVLSGHSHSYQRFRPMFMRGQNEEHPITYIVTGGGGAPPYAVRGHPYLAGAEDAYHYIVFRVEGGHLSLRALRLDGSEIDTLTISKAEGRFDKEYLSEALPEDEFDQTEDKETR